MRAREFIVEINMSPKGLKKMAAGIPDARVGIEFEMLVPDPRSEPDNDLSSIALKFMNDMGQKTIAIPRPVYGGYQKWNPETEGWDQIGDAKPNDCYTIETDGSLRANKGDNSSEGLEFVSNYMPVDDMINDIKRVQQWAKANGCYAGHDNRTGLHINVSIAGQSMENLDYVKLTMMLGDEYISDVFGRLGNTFAQSAFEKVKGRINNLPKKDQKAFFDKMRSGFNQLATRALHSGEVEKYTSIHPKDLYVEFRSPGGDWINEDLFKLESTVDRFVVALDAALSPDKYRKEFLNKLFKLINPEGNETIIDLFKKYEGGKKMSGQELKTDIRSAQAERQIMRSPGKFKVSYGELYRVIDANNANDAVKKAQAIWNLENSKNIEVEPVVPKTQSKNWFREYQPQELRIPQSELNGRSSNPDGNYFISTIADPDVPIYRFEAADINAAKDILTQWRRAYPRWRYASFTLSYDPEKSYGQPGSARLGPSQTLIAPESNPDANWAIVRNSDNAVIEYFIRNTSQEAQTAFDRWLSSIGIDNTTSTGPIYRLSSVVPRIVSRQFSGQWRVLLDGEEIYRFGGIGNSQADANRVAHSWILDQIRRGLLSPSEGAEIEVVPEMV